MGLAEQQYAQDYDEKYTGAYKHQFPENNDPGNGNRAHFEQLLWSYTKSFQVYRCPDVGSGPGLRTDGFNKTDGGVTSGKTVENNPNVATGCATDTSPCGGDYGYNALITPHDGVGKSIGVEQGTGDDNSQSLSAIDSPAETIMMTDSNSQANNWTGGFTDVPNGTFYGDTWGPDTGRNWVSDPGNHGSFDKRHNGGANVLWYDGHVKWQRTSLKDGKPYYWYLKKPVNP